MHTCVTRKDRGCCDRHKEESSVDPVGGNVGVKAVGSEGWRCWPSFGAVGR